MTIATINLGEALPIVFELSQRLTGSYGDNEALLLSIIKKYEVSAPQKVVAVSGDWTAELAKSVTLGMSDNQLEFLKELKKHKQVSHPAMTKFFGAKGNQNPGLTIAGVLSCLTRRCRKHKLSSIYQWDPKSKSYFINPDAEQFIEKYLV